MWNFHVNTRSLEKFVVNFSIEAFDTTCEDVYSSLDGRRRLGIELQQRSKSQLIVKTPANPVWTKTVV